MDHSGGRQKPPLSAGSVEPENEVESDAEALAQLDAGHVTLMDYLQSRIDRAVAPVAGGLSADQLEALKQQLLDQTRSDPSVAALVHAVSGAHAVPDGEED